MISHGVDGSHGKPTTARNAELIKVIIRRNSKKCSISICFFCEIKTLENTPIGCALRVRRMCCKVYPIVINSIISHNRDQSLLYSF